MKGKIGLGIFLVILLGLSSYLVVSLDIIESDVPESQQIMQIFFRYNDSLGIESLDVTKGYYWSPPVGYEVKEGDNFFIYRKNDGEYIPVESFYLIPWVLAERFDEIKKSFNDKGEQIGYPVESGSINVPVLKELIVPVGYYCVLDVASERFILAFDPEGEKDTSDCPRKEKSGETENPDNGNSDDGDYNGLLVDGGGETPIEPSGTQEKNDNTDPNTDFF